MHTCRAFHAEAERLLYRESVYTSHGSGDKLPDDSQSKTQNLFFRAVTHSPSKAALVRVFMSSFFSLTQRHQLLPLLRDFLHALPNLKELSLSSAPHEGVPCVRHLDIESCTFQLEVFRLDCHADEVDLLRFLAKQPAIRTLGIASWRISYAVPADILPNLDTLIGAYGFVYNSLRGRHVRHMFCTLDHERIADDAHGPYADFPLDSLRHVQVLRYRGFLPLFFSTIGNHLSNLLTLEMPFGVRDSLLNNQ